MGKKKEDSTTKWSEIPADLRKRFLKYFLVLVDYSEFDGDRRGMADHLSRARSAMTETELFSCVNAAAKKLSKGLL